jgi:hypothetical protein
MVVEVVVEVVFEKGEHRDRIPCGIDGCGVRSN